MQVSHEPPGLIFPWSVTASPFHFGDHITGIQNIRGIPGATYTITARLLNSEGLSEPVSQTITIPGPPDQPQKPDRSRRRTHLAGGELDGPGRQRPGNHRVFPAVQGERGPPPGKTGPPRQPRPPQPSQRSNRAPVTRCRCRQPTPRETAHGRRPQRKEQRTSAPPSAYLFPRGSPASLEFDGPLATDPGGGAATHAFTFKIDGEDKSLTPAKALLKVEGPDEDHDFKISADGAVTPTQFRARPTAAESNRAALKGELTLSNENDQSATLEFDLNLTYDDSPQFGSPAVHGTGNRWAVAAAYETYEGITELPDITLPWTALTDGPREWSAGTPTAVTFRCSDPRGERPAGWPAPAERDSALFSVSSETPPPSPATSPWPSRARRTSRTPPTTRGQPKTAASRSRTRATTSTTCAVTSDHDLHGLGTEGGGTGCNGSAVDLTIRVKDVGPPAPPTGFTVTRNRHSIQKLDLYVGLPRPQPVHRGRRKGGLPGPQLQRKQNRHIPLPGRAHTRGGTISQPGPIHTKHHRSPEPAGGTPDHVHHHHEAQELRGLLKIRVGRDIHPRASRPPKTRHRSGRSRRTPSGQPGKSRRTTTGIRSRATRSGTGGTAPAPGRAGNIPGQEHRPSSPAWTKRPATTCRSAP